jgi:ADP-heptose:LPS heptosyltransferase
MFKLKNFKSILIIRPDRIGDLTLSLAVPAAIKAVHPDIRLEYLVSVYAAPVLKYSNHIDGFLHYTDDLGYPKPVIDLVQLLDSRKYDGAIFLKPDWRSAFAVYLAGIPVRIGTARRAYSFLFNERLNLIRKKSGMHEVDLNLRLLEPLGLKVPPGLLSPMLTVEGRPWPNRQSFNIPSKYAIVHLGSKGSAANWPLDNYIRLIDELSADIPIIVTGQLPSALNLPKSATNLIGQTDIDDLIHFIAGASLLISGGTGPLHLASALGRPLIGLFPYRPHIGPGRWGPRSRNAVTITASEQTGHRCRIKKDGSCDCMAAIEYDLVIDKARGLLNE